VIVGQFFLPVIEWLRTRLDRRQRRADERDDFQLRTLLNLQDTLDELGQNLAAVVVLRERGVSLPGRRKDVPFTNPHASAPLKSSIRLTTLAE